MLVVFKVISLWKGTCVIIIDALFDMQIVDLLICRLWIYLINDIIIVIFKSKNPREECGNYWGLDFIVAVGKIFSGIVLLRFDKYVRNSIFINLFKQNLESANSELEDMISITCIYTIHIVVYIYYLHSTGAGKMSRTRFGFIPSIYWP